MKPLVLALSLGAAMALGFGAIGALALGSEILDPANGAIEERMPADAKETSGVLDVLEGVAERLDEVLPDDVERPDVELPDEADAGMTRGP